MARSSSSIDNRVRVPWFVFCLLFSLSTLVLQHSTNPCVLRELTQALESPLQSFSSAVFFVAKDEEGKPNVLDEVVRLLLPPERAEKHIRRYPGRNFSYYLYELPEEYHRRTLGRCIAKRYLDASNCDWGSTTCTERDTRDGRYSARRFNRNADFVVAKVLDEYRGPLRTNNHAEADLFIVPYPSAAYCMCHSRQFHCPSDVPVEQLDAVFSNLTYWNRNTSHRHLFTDSIDYRAVHTYFRVNAPLLASIGPSQGCQNRVANCGQLVLPYANTNPQNQPQRLRHKSLDERTYAFSAFMSPRISGRSDDRIAFYEAVQRLPNQTLAGRPTLVNAVRHRMISGEEEIQQAYRNSIFCPCLRGDEPPQKRFFDALLGGCIPVVLEHSRSKEPPFPSWFAPGADSIHRTYPFARGTFAGWDDMGIDYHDVVVTVNGTCGIACLFPTLEDLLLHQPEVVLEKHRNVARVAPLLTYGMEENGLQHPDAVASILVEARHYVETHYGQPATRERVNQGGLEALRRD